MRGLKLPTLLPITLIMRFIKPKAHIASDPKAEKGEFKAVTKCFPTKFPIHSNTENNIPYTPLNGTLMEKGQCYL